MLQEMISRADALLFDFDGVVADSEPFYYETYNTILGKRGHQIDREEYWEYWTCKGHGLPGEIQRHNLSFSDEEVDAIMDERRTYYSGLCQNGRIPLYAGMTRAVELLVEKGKKCAIASNSFEDDILAVLRHGGCPTPCFPVVGRREGLRTKPKPDIFIYTAGILDCTPKKCLVVEDALKGLEAARTAGMSCALIRSPFNQKADFSGADGVIQSHEAFCRAVEEWAQSAR